LMRRTNKWFLFCVFDGLQFIRLILNQ
jgi:hypothetical protein